LLRVEKLAAVGRISSTIAHEINNPLAAVTNLLYLALLDPSLGDTVRRYLATAQDELSRLGNITRLTLSYARPQIQVREVDPVEVIESVLFLFRVRLEAKNIQLVRAFPEDERVKVSLFVDELQRIFTNLLANAIDAVGSIGGMLRIVVEGRGSDALIVVEDNGVGIPEERRERIFEPFYTTKEEVGTGIGLWVTKELVEKNGGSISFAGLDGEEFMRTRFEVRFPRCESGANRAA
jgi:signal transduction histidine kinase